MMRAHIAPMAATAANHALIDAGSRMWANTRTIDPAYPTSNSAVKFLEEAP
jgi:hypothetical protein